MSARHAQVLTALDCLEGGEHVGWIVHQPAEFTQLAARCLRQGAAAGDKLLLFGPRWRTQRHPLPVDEQVTVLDPRREFLAGGPLEPQTVYAAFRRQAALAAEQGYRGLRVVTDMDWLLDAPPGTGLAQFEQGLDEVAADTGATIVCAYRRQNFAVADLAAITCVHPHQLGESPRDPGFRIWASGAQHWHLSGQVDLRGAQAFPTALRTAAHGRQHLRLDCTGLEFMNAAGMRAIALLAHDTAVTVSLEGANETLRRYWTLMDWDGEISNVEFCA